MGCVIANKRKDSLETRMHTEVAFEKPRIRHFRLKLNKQYRKDLGTIIEVRPSMELSPHVVYLTSNFK